MSLIGEVRKCWAWFRANRTILGFPSEPRTQDHRPCPYRGRSPPRRPSIHKTDEVVRAIERIRFQAGPYTANKPCGVPPGQRFITSDTPDFAEVFACLARSGDAAGGLVMHGDTLGRALAFDLEHGCNAGFLREDALLMVVQIVAATVEEATPWDWADYALDAKGGDQDMAVALAISVDWMGYQPGPLCEEGKTAPHPPTFVEWTEYFDHGVHGSKCAPTYAPFFAEAASIAAELCDPVPR